MDFEKKLIGRRSVDDKGCWNWTGSTNPNGYGQINDRGKVLKVHRIAASLWLGLDLNSKDLVLHKCDNKVCYNPDHLYIGSKSNNAKDYHNSLKAQGRQIDWFPT